MGGPGSREKRKIGGRQLPQKGFDQKGGGRGCARIFDFRLETKSGDIPPRRLRMTGTSRERRGVSRTKPKKGPRLKT